jgi:hypothetical protein
LGGQVAGGSIGVWEWEAAVNFSYEFPLHIQMGARRVEVIKIRHGVTEATLSNGQLVRLSIHLDSVKLNPENTLDVSYQVITEIMAEPEFPIMEVHEGLQ